MALAKHVPERLQMSGATGQPISQEQCRPGLLLSSGACEQDKTMLFEEVAFSRSLPHLPQSPLLGWSVRRLRRQRRPKPRRPPKATAVPKPESVTTKRQVAKSADPKVRGPKSSNRVDLHIPFNHLSRATLISSTTSLLTCVCVCVCLRLSRRLLTCPRPSYWGVWVAPDCLFFRWVNSPKGRRPEC